MSDEELKIKVTELLPSVTFEAGVDFLGVHAAANDWPALAKQLRWVDDFWMDYLFCLTCIDRMTELTMVYHLSSTRYRHSLVIKVSLDRNKPEIESVSHIWRGAEFFEREVYEMFGVRFLNHPDLRLLILPEGWEGKNPLRKDFEDPVNMIKL